MEVTEIQDVLFKTEPNNIGPPAVIGFPKHRHDTRVNVTLVAAYASCTKAMQVRTLAYSRAERAFILEHNLTSKSSAAVHDAFSTAYTDVDVPNKTTVHLLVTVSSDIESVCPL
jgi:hypothetical protein